MEGRYVTIFCGRGNNGGDGFVSARRLSEAGANVAVVLTDGDPKTPEAAEMLQRIGVMDIAVVGYGDDPEYLTERLASTDLLVDAIYGTGFHGELDERHRDVCRLINGVGVRVFALDIPSGVNADTGEADPCAVRAGMTVVFDSDKPATAMPAAAEYCGEVVVGGHRHSARRRTRGWSPSLPSSTAAGSSTGCHAAAATPTRGITASS